MPTSKLLVPDLEDLSDEEVEEDDNVLLQNPELASIAHRLQKLMSDSGLQEGDDEEEEEIRLIQMQGKNGSVLAPLKAAKLQLLKMKRRGQVDGGRVVSVATLKNDNDGDFKRQKEMGTQTNDDHDDDGLLLARVQQMEKLIESARIGMSLSVSDTSIMEASILQQLHTTRASEIQQMQLLQTLLEIEREYLEKSQLVLETMKVKTVENARNMKTRLHEMSQTLKNIDRDASNRKEYIQHQLSIEEAEYSRCCERLKELNALMTIDNEQASRRQQQRNLLHTITLKASAQQQWSDSIELLPSEDFLLFENPYVIDVDPRSNDSPKPVPKVQLKNPFDSQR